MAAPPTGNEPQTPRFAWPGGAQCALSLSFDDARLSQADAGMPLFERFRAKATFYVSLPAVRERLETWKKAVAYGHEIGNHTVNHPCTGNRTWARGKAVEDYTLDRMREELAGATGQIRELLGVTPRTFAYPCGNTYVGRGVETRSYVPLVAELFLAGRGWLDEGPNDPWFCDLAQLQGMPMDQKSFAEIRELLETAKEEARWVVLAGHEIGEDARLTTRQEMLEELLPYALAPENRIWLATVGRVAEYVREQRGEKV